MSQNSIQSKEAISALLVEDTKVDATLIRTWLEEFSLVYDFKVFTVETLASARDCLRNHEWGCILLDLVLPNGSGLDTLRQVRDLAPNTPLLVMTGLDRDQVESQAVAMADEFLIKWELAPGIALTPVEFCRKMRHAIIRRRSLTEAKCVTKGIHETQQRAEEFIKRGEEDPNVAPFDPGLAPTEEAKKIS